MEDYVNHTKQGRKPSPVISSTTKKKLIAFGWYGGKYSHLKWVLPHLETPHQTYCEPFAGSAAVLLNKPVSSVEVYNDIDGDVVNFFSVLRESPDELIRLLELTPYSRYEYAQACEPIEGLTDIEQARRFYIRARQTRTGLAQTASLGRWANCVGTSRRGMAGVVSRWQGGIEKLDDVSGRLMRVQIEDRPAIDCIKAYDSNETLFYVDPPYLHESRGDTKSYAYEMTESDHQLLFECLDGIDGKAVVSGYRGEFMDSRYSEWNMCEDIVKQAHSVKADRQEVVWKNF